MTEQSARGLRTSGVDLHVGHIARKVRAGLMDVFREAIRTGRLAPGTRLPSSRVLAGDLGLSRNTVVRVYSELINEGWLLGLHGSGTEVAQQPTEWERPRPLATRPQLVHDLRPGWPLDFFRHPGSTSDRDGVVIGFAAPSPSAWSGVLDALVRALR